jgi:hypothetical protein
MAFHPITLVALAPDAQRSVAWVSVADKGDVSAGLTDRSIVIADPGGERDGSRNPHFTFHPPIYHHLRSNGEPEVLAGLMEIGAMLEQTAVVPWVRLVSRPYQHLATFQTTRGGAGVLDFSIADPGLSAQIELDFIRPSEIRTGDSQFKYARVSSDLGLRLAVQSCPPSRASLTLLWQG